MTSFIFVGLGNPGDEYKDTRHNTGRIVLEYFRKSREFPEWEFDKMLNAQVSRGKLKKKSVILVLPDTFMNKSGETVKKLIKSKAQAESLAVIHDELDIASGRVKMSFNKSSGGHRGVESIMKAVKTEAFTRVRVGISPANAKGVLKKPQGEEEVGDFILGKFKPSEMSDIKKISKKVADSLEIFALDGRDKATGICNTEK
ncbi:MAG: aminoacyl-tRNA hydrolase [bacterium]